ncbi:hypothetical protein EV182_005276, partial [Spiromyces aspiralis]
MTSPARTTSILLPQSGITVINVHTPTPPKADFFASLHQHATLLQQCGWQILIIGNFNTTRNTYDRSTTKPPDTPPTFYELIHAMQLLDVADHLYPADETLALQPEYSYDSLFTFGKTKEGKQQLVSCIDLFLAQASIIARARCWYHAMDVRQLSDHKVIYLHLIPPTPDEATAICPLFHIAPNLIDDPRHKQAVNKQLTKYRHLPTEQCMTDNNPVATLAEVLSEIRCYFCEVVKKQARPLLHEVEALQCKHQWLFHAACSTGQQQKENITKKLQAVEKAVVEKMAAASAHIYNAAAHNWLCRGGCISQWSTVRVQRATCPPRTPVIKALVPPSGHECQPITDRHQLADTASDFYKKMYAPVHPPTSVISELLRQHAEYIATRPKRPSDQELVAMEEPISMAKIDCACSHARCRKAPGPDGIPAELYIKFPIAWRILHHLTNLILRRPDLVTDSLVA